MTSMISAPVLNVFSQNEFFHKKERFRATKHETGNKCGHIRGEFKQVELKISDKTPFIISKGILRIEQLPQRRDLEKEQSRKFYKQKKCYKNPEITVLAQFENCATLKQKIKKRPLLSFCQMLKSKGSKRGDRRSEKLEIAALVGKFLLSRFGIGTRACVNFNNSKIVSDVSVEQMAKTLDINHSRISRLLSDFQEIEYIERGPKTYNEQFGCWDIRRIKLTWKFFKELGITHDAWVKAEKHATQEQKSYSASERARYKADRAANKQGSNNVTSIFGGLLNKVQASQANSSIKTDETGEAKKTTVQDWLKSLSSEQRISLNKEIARIYQHNNLLSHDDLYRLSAQNLSLPPPPTT